MQSREGICKIQSYEEIYKLIESHIKLISCNLKRLLIIMERYGYSNETLKLIKNNKNPNISGFDKGLLKYFVYYITIDNENYKFIHLNYYGYLNDKKFDIIKRCMEDKASKS